LRIYLDRAGVYLRAQAPSPAQAGYLRTVGAEHTPDVSERRIAYAEALGRLLGVGTEVTDAGGTTIVQIIVRRLTVADDGTGIPLSFSSE
jgi:hypothetical protein